MIGALCVDPREWSPELFGQGARFAPPEREWERLNGLGCLACGADNLSRLPPQRVFEAGRRRSSALVGRPARRKKQSAISVFELELSSFPSAASDSCNRSLSNNRWRSARSAAPPRCSRESRCSCLREASEVPVAAKRFESGEFIFNRGCIIAPEKI